MSSPLRLGTRTSALAVAQATGVAEALAALGQPVELVEIATAGDAGATEDKARFVKELETALLADEISLAVHSAKDVPGELPEGLCIAGVPDRADPRDALCLAPHLAGAAGTAEPGATGRPEVPFAGWTLDALPQGAAVGTASLRRRAQLLALRPDLEIRQLRGNVDTRLKRLAETDLDAIVLAAAGLTRLGREDVGTPLPADMVVPAPGQGCLALEARANDAAARRLAERLADPFATAALTAERALVASLGATCDTPVGAHAALDGNRLRLNAFVGLPDGATWVHDEVVGPSRDPAALGDRAAGRLRAVGAAEILAAAERWNAA